MNTGSFLLGVMVGESRESASASGSGSLLIVELILCSIGAGFYLSSWVVFWCCLITTVLIALIPLLHFIVVSILTVFFTYGAFLFGNEYSIHAAILSAIFVFLLVAGTHFNFDSSVNESKS